MIKSKKNKSTKKRLVIFIIAAVVGIAAWLTFSKLTKKPDFETLTVTKETRENIMEVSGNIEPAREQKLQVGGLGTVKDVWVKEGGRVKKGDKLFSLDALQQEYALANHDFMIKQESMNGPSIKLNLMQKQRSFLEKQLSDRTVEAWFDGTLVAFNVQPGQYVTDKDQVGVLVDRTFLKATVGVSEIEAARLKIGLPVDFKFLAIPDIKIRGEVVSYPAIAKVSSSGAVVVQTELRIQNPPETVLPGYSFTAQIIVGPPDEILLFAKEGIRYDEGKPFVDKFVDGKFEPTAVEVEAHGPTMLRIISGLKEGDKIKNQQVGGMGGETF